MKLLRALLILLFLCGCTALAYAIFHRPRIQEARQTLTATFAAPASLSPLFQHPTLEQLATLPTVTHWAYPVGSSRGALIYNAQPFGTTRHLGEDLNGIGGENSDLGDPVYAVAPGLVTFAAHAGEGWGNVIIILHAVAADPAAPLGPRRYVQSFYAHMEEISVKTGQLVAQEQEIGTVGGAAGRYLAHLHFEMRELVNPYIGPGYGDSAPAAWIAPEATIKQQLADETQLLQAQLKQVVGSELQGEVVISP